LILQPLFHIIFPKLEDGIVVPEDKQKMLAIADVSEYNHAYRKSIIK